LADWTFGIEILARVWDAVASFNAPFRTEAFVKAYADVVDNALDLAADVPQLGPQELEETTGGVLRAIALVVSAYHGHGKVQINANYMIPMPPSKELLEAASFLDKRRKPESFERFLVLQDWGSAHGTLPNIILPVEKQGGTVLFGAPSSYSHNARYVVRDTRWLRKHLRGYESRELRQDVKRYFREHEKQVRSFVSWPLVASKGGDGIKANQVVAIVNVDSNRPAVLGLFPGNQRKLHIVLVPLLNLLTKLVVRKHYQTMALPNEESPKVP
jgi:hypothetical protein